MSREQLLKRFVVERRYSDTGKRPWAVVDTTVSGSNGVIGAHSRKRGAERHKARLIEEMIAWQMELRTLRHRQGLE